MTEQDLEALIMKQPGDNMIDFDFDFDLKDPCPDGDLDLNDLFPDGDLDLNDLFLYADFSSIMSNDVLFSSGVELEDDDQNQSPPPLQANTNEEPVERIRLVPEEQQVVIAIVDDEQLNQNLIEYQNSDIPNIQISQQASGNKNGIMYQMYPSLFDIIDGVMSVKQQPKANNRSRYQSDGARFIPDSRHHPMSINLPDLQAIALAHNQTLGIVQTIVTSSNNPMHETIVHANDIIYHQPNAEKIGYGCVFTPLEKQEIKDREKQFKRFSIIYKKCDEYTFDLTPFHPLTMFGTTEKYINTTTNKKNAGNAAKGKTFKRDYDLSSYKIVFHLAFKQDNVIFISNITCETEIVQEEKPSQKSVKRSAPSMTESLSDDDDDESNSSIQIRTHSKKFKSSAPPMTGLPVTRISSSNINDSTESDTDSNNLSLVNGLIRGSVNSHHI